MAHKYDVREIKLIKTTIHRDLKRFIADKESCGYVCLGHFDMMEIKKLEWSANDNQTPLDAICMAQAMMGELPDSNALDMNYCYPLYIIQQDADDPVRASDIDKFWAQSSNYTVVTRLHCEQTDNQKESFILQLIQRVNQHRKRPGGNEALIFPLTAGKDYYHLNVCLSAGDASVYVAFYESLELGDIVAVIKSNSLIAILETQRHLYECDIVSDSYSYYGIDKKIFGSDVFTVDPYEPSLLSATSLEYVSTRCSVRIAKEADKFLNDVKGWPTYKPKEVDDPQKEPSSFFVSGTADIVIRWGMGTSISEADFLKVVSGMIFSDIRTCAFYDVITRIGLPYVRPENSRSRLPKHDKFEAKVSKCANFLQLSKEKAFDRFDIGENWPGQTARMLATLNTMYSNSVTDELSAMLLDGVDAFLDRLCFLADHPQTWKSWYNEDICEFLDCWASLTNDITHIEGQLVQHPELNPIRYYFPAMVLQLEQQWARKCANAIQTINGGPVSSVLCPILVPSPVENASTRCLLDPENTNYHGMIPLRVKIPIGQLYDAWKMLHILCHEMAHYCGEELRDRKARLETMATATAHYIFDLLERQIKQYVSKGTFSVPDSFLNKIAKSILPKPTATNEVYYLKNTVMHLTQEANRLISDSGFLEEYVRQVCSQDPSETQLAALRALDEMTLVRVGQNIQRSTAYHLDYCLGHLCKECYADIVMVLLLGCSFQDYYECVYADEEQKLSAILTPSESEVATNLHITRMALVISSLDNVYEKDWCEKKGYESEWISKALEKHTLCQGAHAGDYLNIGSEWCCLSIAEAKCILEYLIPVAKNLKKSLEPLPQNLGTIDRLQEILKHTQGQNFDWTQIRKFVEDSKNNQ